MPKLRFRNRQPEIMDQPGLDVECHREALRGLARINWLSRSNAVIWPIVEKMAVATNGSLSVLDVACGSGDVAISLAAKAKKKQLSVETFGCDISETALKLAEQNAKQQGVTTAFFQADILNDPLPLDYDIVTCSLFLHHLDETDAIALLTRMAAAARQLVIVNDLVRSHIGYWLAFWGTRLLSRSSIVHADGPMSVQAAFRPDEVQSLASKAGLENVQLTRHWPQRFLLTWKRDS